MDFNLLLKASDAKFVAQAYSDYLAKIAAGYEKIISASTSAIADVQNSIDQLTDNLRQEKAELLTIINEEAEALGYHLAEMDSSSQAYVDLIDSLAANNSRLRSYVTDHYTSSSLILSNLNAFVNPTFEVSINDSTVGRDAFLGFANTPDLVCYSASIQSVVSQAAENILTENGIPLTSSMMLNAGCTSVKSVVMAIIEDGLNSQPNTALKLTLADVDGTVFSTVFNRSYTTVSLVDELKQSMSACVTSAAAFSALQINNLSDRVVQFTSAVASKFSDAYTQMNAFYTEIKRKVSDTRTNIQNFIEYFMEECGWNRVLAHASTTDPGYVDGLSPFAQMTGASPTAAINTTAAMSLLGAAFKTIFGTIATIFKAGVTAASDWLNAVVDKAYNTYTNPYDLASLSNSSDSQLIDQFRIERQQSQTLLKALNDQGEYAATLALCQERKGKWLKMALIYGEVLFRIDEINIVSSSQASIDYTISCKPKPINALALARLLNYDPAFRQRYCCEAYLNVYPANPNGCYHTGNVDPSFTDARFNFKLSDPNDWTDVDAASALMTNFLTDLADKIQSDPAFKVDFSDAYGETSALCSYYAGYWLLYATFMWSAKLCLSSDDNHFPAGFTLAYVALLMTQQPRCQLGIVSNSSTTNLDWLKMATGMTSENSSVYFPLYSYTKNSATELYFDYKSNDLSTFGVFVWINLFTHWFDEAAHPTDFEFMPYTSGTEGYSQPQFYIKTDAQNQALATNALTALVAVVVVAAIAIAIGTTVKLVKLKKMSKLTTWIGQRDSAAWSGKRMSLTETWLYSRKTNKLDKLTSVSAGLVGSTTESGVGKLLANPYVQQVVESTTGIAIGDNDDYLPNKNGQATSVRESLANVKDDTSTIIDDEDASALNQDAIYYQLTKSHL